MSKVTILGTGAMGSRMAKSLMKSGHEVTVWNRDAKKADPLTQLGVIAATSPRSAVKAAEYVISMVRDDEASQHVWLGDDGGALAGIPEGAVAIESSTLTVGWIKALAVHCRKRNVAFLDAPVAGSLPQADAAQLIYFVGGDEKAYEQARPLLLAMGKATHHAGPSGSGAAVKLMVNALYGIQLASLGELIGLVRRLGFDEAKAVELMASTPVCSPAAKIGAEAMLDGRFSPLFPIGLVAKDLAYVLQTAASSEAEVPMAEAACQRFAKAVEEGYGADNITGIAQLYQ